MGWFDEQIKTRINSDENIFEESFLEIASAVLGRKISSVLEDETLQMRSAMDRILRFYHIRPGEEVPDSIKSVNERLEYLLRPHGIMRRDVILSKGWYKDAFGAMLGIKADTGEAVALIPNKFGGYHYFDASAGKNVSINKKNAGLFAEEAIAFYIPFPAEKLKLRDLAWYMIKLFSPFDVAVSTVLTFAISALGLLMPILNKWLFSTVILSDSVRPLIMTAIFIICLTVSQLLIGVAKSFASTRLTTKMQISVEAATMARILSLPASFFKNYGVGELSNKAGNLRKLCDLIVNFFLSSGISGVFSLMYIVQIFSFTPALAVPAILTILAVTVLSVLSSLLQISISKKRMQLSSAENSLSYSIVTGIQKIKLTGAEKRVFAKWGSQYAKGAALTYNPPMLLKVNSVLITAINLAGMIVIYFFAAKTKISVADYYAFNTSYGLVSGAITAIAGLALSAVDIKPMLDLCQPIMETQPETAENKQLVERLTGSIEINHLSFGYADNAPLVIDDLSLKIRPGEYVAIVGTTGCGKSTLMRLLLGLEKPKKGAIFYDGKNLDTIDLKSLRQKIGSVMQEGKLFQGDIYSNITISAPWLSVDDAWKAAEIAGIADDLRDMPMGMMTMISEGQGGISGGQKQRLMIARAVAPKPRILMFDEATSALDNITQKMVSDALATMKCTRIVIAHRLSTIRQCDRILVLDKGHIIQEGTYEELIAREGFFAELVERQRVDV